MKVLLVPATPAKICPVILCGGKGTRLWPVSRADHPKQFLQLTGKGTLFQQTLQRVSDPASYAQPLLVTNADYRFLAAEQALETGIEPQAILLEPEGRNTAPAIAAAALTCAKTDPQTLMLVLPSDHAIADAQIFAKTVAIAADAASDGYLVTFGIIPDRPETGFGYIKSGAEIAEQTMRVERFIEKPDETSAQNMIDAGGHYWNSGMFCFTAQSYIEQCEKLAPDVLSSARSALENASTDLDFTRLDTPSYSASPNISIDYAIMEQTDRAVVVPASFGWSDLGAWDAVHEAGQKDDQGNVVTGPALLHETSGSLIQTGAMQVTVAGLDNVAVIVSEDAVLVAPLERAQETGQLVKLLAQNEKTAHLTQEHRTTYRPWGGYTRMLEGHNFQVKRIFVKPGKRLSLQRHQHRSEHWVVVRGAAEVTLGEKTFPLNANESVYVPATTVHRLANTTNLPLEIIEVQTGSYLGEDDIERLEDEFGRT